jgi:hypothetical protein
MNIDKAIELLTTLKEGWPLTDSEQYYVAVELGVEALKRIKADRSTTLLLPGEDGEF